MVKRHEDLREVQLSCPTLTFLHKLQVYEVFSILFPNGRREKTCVRGHLLRKKGAWPWFRLEKTFEDQKMIGDVKERLKTYPEERLRASDGELTMARKRNVPSSETRDK